MTKKTDALITIRSITGFIAYMLLTPVILFANAGTLNWTMGWIYFGSTFLFTIGSRVLLYFKNPDLIQERARYQDAEGVKSWDKVLVPIAAIICPIATIVVAGLDKRYTWTNVIPLWGQVIAACIAFLGMTLSTWAMIENRFFSAVVRIQKDRGHTVCTTGPYRWVRHPGYAGGILFYIMTPFILNSMWSFIPVAASCVFTIIRTALEDNILNQELDGYKEFSRKTRYRLIPWIW